MSVSMEVVYQCDLHCKAVHGPSRQELQTDAPADAGGRADRFSPTDLLGVALGACVLTVMGAVAQRGGVDFKGARATVEKEMAADPLRRVGSLKVTVFFPPEQKMDLKMRSKQERAAHSCPVGQSLHPDVKVEVKFV